MEATYENLNPELKDEISRIFSPRSIYSNPKSKELMGWTKGSRSDIHRIFVTGEAEGEGLPHYAIKINYLEKDFFTEKAAFTITDKYAPGLFPKVLSLNSKICDKYLALVLKVMDEPTLFNELDEKEHKAKQFEISQKIDFDYIYHFLGTSLKIQTELSKDEEEISNELSRISNGKVDRLDEIDAVKYADRFYNALTTINPNLRVKGLWNLCYQYARNNLVGTLNEKRAVTQEDGWGDHVTRTGGLDGNSIKKGSWIQQISCLIMHPKVFNKFNNAEEAVRKVADYCIRYTKRKESLEDVERGLYQGGIYSNIRLSAFKKENFNFGMKRALLKQAKLLIKKTGRGNLEEKLISILIPRIKL
jgi:hypothetical protein